MSLNLAAEKQVAIAAVRRACVLTASVFNNLVKNETLTKDDSSPVTGQCVFASSSHDGLEISVGLTFYLLPQLAIFLRRQ